MVEPQRIDPGAIVSYLDMCQIEGAALQRGMNYRLGGTYSVVLMSRRANAPYRDRIEDDERTLVYEGHDVSRSGEIRDPKSIDQPMRNLGGSLTQNGLFYEAAQRAKFGGSPDLVRVYEKVRPGIWVYNGPFELKDAWVEPAPDQGRAVFKFRMQLTELMPEAQPHVGFEDGHPRLIPGLVKQEVWRRDRGRCVMCGAEDNLHFDHVIPYSRGGSSRVAVNVQLLCARHNLTKRDRIE